MPVTAAAAAQHSVGEIVEVYSFTNYPPWKQAQILSVGGVCGNPDKPYLVHFVNDLPGNDRCYGDVDIRPLTTPGTPATPVTPAPTVAVPPPPAPMTTTGPAPTGPITAPPTGPTTPTTNPGEPTTNPGEAPPSQIAPANLKVGARVDVFLSDNIEAKNRGTIVSINGNMVKVHYDGCKVYLDEIIDVSRVRPAAALSPKSPEVAFFRGSWLMFTPGYPTTLVKGDSLYREYGVGAKAPPLVIKADGTYVWYFSFGKAPVKGRWTPHAKIVGARFGTETVDGVIIKDPSGNEWKVSKTVSTRDTADHLTARLMCSGETVMGTRSGR